MRLPLQGPRHDPYSPLSRRVPCGNVSTVVTPIKACLSLLAFAVCVISVDARRAVKAERSLILMPLHTNQEIALSHASQGVQFDLDGDGVPNRVSWPIANAGILSIDLNANGTIDDGRELFVDSVHSSSLAAFIKMAGADLKAQRPLLPDETEGRGAFLDARHPLFHKLLVWFDWQRDGVSQPAELLPLSRYMSKIGLTYSLGFRTDQHGNTFRYEGWVELQSGQRTTVYDVLPVTQ